jgi:hypothetical protein
MSEAGIFVPLVWVIFKNSFRLRSTDKQIFVSLLFLIIFNYFLIQASITALTTYIDSLQYLLMSNTTVTPYLIITIPIILDIFTSYKINRFRLPASTEGIWVKEFFRAALFFSLLMVIFLISALIFWGLILLGNIFHWKLLWWV